MIIYAESWNLSSFSLNLLLTFSFLSPAIKQQFFFSLDSVQPNQEKKSPGGLRQSARYCCTTPRFNQLSEPESKLEIISRVSRKFYLAILEKTIKSNFKEKDREVSSRRFCKTAELG
jgi:hypothetical protein